MVVQSSCFSDGFNSIVQLHPQCTEYIRISGCNSPEIRRSYRSLGSDSNNSTIKNVKCLNWSWATISEFVIPLNGVLFSDPEDTVSNSLLLHQQPLQNEREEIWRNRNSQSLNPTASADHNLRQFACAISISFKERCDWQDSNVCLVGLMKSYLEKEKEHLLELFVFSLPWQVKLHYYSKI